MRHTTPWGKWISIVCLLALTGCTPQKPQYRIGFSQCLDDDWRQKMNYEMEREMLLHPDLTITTRMAQGNNELQCAQIDSFIAERIDLLIVSPNEAAEVKPAITRAYRAGIPVVIADRRVTGNDYTAFIGGDNHNVGRLMAEWVIQTAISNQLSAISHPQHVVEITGMPGSMAATGRHTGLMEGIEAYGRDRIIVHSVPGYLDTYTEMSRYLESRQPVDIIVAQNDRMAIEASRAYRDYQQSARSDLHHQSPISNQQSPIPIMGVDANDEGLQAIVDGKITCSATYPSRGDLIIATAAQILHGEPYAKDTVIETTLIDKTAAAALLIQNKERLHDLETLKSVQQQSDERWKRVQLDRILMVIGLIIFFLLFLTAVAYIVLRQTRLQTEIKREILPQLEEVQEAMQLSRKDEAFIERLNQIIDEHLSDPDLTVENLGSMLQLSRTQIFRRVKAITGLGPLEYIRERRLIRADELLQTTDKTIQQVALEFCFNSPGYFSKCYKDYFGHLPSERK